MGNETLKNHSVGLMGIIVSIRQGHARKTVVVAAAAVVALSRSTLGRT